MSDTITLPRAVVEEVVRFIDSPNTRPWPAGTQYRLSKALRAALDAALAETERHVSLVCPQCNWTLQEQEPKKERAETAIPARGVGVKSGETDSSRGEAYRTPEPDAKREPATREVIQAKCEVNLYVHWGSFDDFEEGWREAERFHGITTEDK